MTTETTQIDATAIRGAITAAAPLAVVHVEQTGGGTATMYVGDYNADTGLAWLAIGPGSYNWADPWRSTFWLDDLNIGPDDNGEYGVYLHTLAELTAYVQHACADCGRPEDDHLTRDQWAGDTRDGLGCAYTDGTRQNRRN